MGDRDAPRRRTVQEKPKGTAWRTKPSAYIVANHDHAVHPIWNAPRPSAWAPRPTRSTAATADALPARRRAQRSPQPRGNPPKNSGDGVIRSVLCDGATTTSPPRQGSSVRRGGFAPPDRSPKEVDIMPVDRISRTNNSTDPAHRLSRPIAGSTLGRALQPRRELRRVLVGKLRPRRTASYVLTPIGLPTRTPRGK